MFFYSFSSKYSCTLAEVMENQASQNSIEDNSICLEKQKRIFKIIVIGDSNVGKTCLTFRFCGGKFPMRTEATIGVDFRERQVVVDGELIKVCFKSCN